MTPEIVEDPGLRIRHRFRTVGESLEVETWIEPGGGVTPHVHPVMHERFEVLEGRAQFLSGRRWTESGPGESAAIPAGTRHAFRNRSDAVAHIRCLATPGQLLQSFLEDAAALGRAGALGPSGLPKSPDALMQAAVLVEEHREMVTLMFPPLPPRALQRLVMPPLARLGRRRGYASGRLGDRASHRAGA